MKLRLLLPIAAALVAATLASTAGADVFVVVEPASAEATTLPSAAFPNLPGSVVFPADLSTPPASPVTLDWAQLLALWQRAGAAYGIPWQVLAAINQVESDFGRNMGPSSAGAVGWMQFMPGTWMEWGVDGNGDGVADPWNPYDAVYAAARYLAASGGATDISRAIFSYNHADWYVQEVLRLATLYGQGQQDGAVTLAAQQPSLAATRHAVAVAGRRAAAATAGFHHLAARVARLERRASRTPLLSTQLDLQARAGRMREQLPAARAWAAQARKALARARRALQQAQQSAATSSFSAGTYLTAYGDGASLPATTVPPSSAAGEAVTYALAQLGTPYLWGGEGVTGFDCSGLVQASYDAAGVSLPRVAQEQYDATAANAVPLGQVQPGDLVFFGTSLTSITHVGMVVGPGEMIDAPHAGAVVRTESFAWPDLLAATRPTGGTDELLASSRTLLGRTAQQPAARGSGPVFTVVPTATPSVVLFTRP